MYGVGGGSSTQQLGSFRNGAQSKPEWDRNADGRISSDDLLMGFDSNNDGFLDKNELQIVSGQLSSQLDYNNSLLARMQEIEEEHAKQNLEINSQQDMIKDFVRTVESLKQENAEATRKLRVAQEIAENLSKQLRDTRVENSALKKDSEDSLGSHMHIARERDDIRREYNDVALSLERAETKNEALTEQFEAYKNDMESKHDRLKQECDIHKREVGDMRAKHTNVDFSRRDLEENLKEVNKSF